MKKSIFLSYSSLRSSDAAVIEAFFSKNGTNIIKDTNEDKTYWKFMDKIKTCDCVVMVLNNSFFESPLCTYEVVKSYACNKKIYPIWFSNLEIIREEERMTLYERLIKKDMNIAPEQKKDFLDKIATFDKYNEIILKLMNEVRFPQKGESLIDACNEIYEAIYKKSAKILSLEDEMDIRGRYLHDLDYVDNEFLRAEFIWLLGDLKRCSSFRTSLFAEDPSGEKEWRFKGYTIRKGCLGLSLYIYTTSMEGESQIIDIHDICGVDSNRENLGSTFMKYYIKVFDRELYKKYLYQMKLPHKIRDKNILAEFKQYGKMNHRIILNYDDSNAFENMSITIGQNH